VGLAPHAPKGGGGSLLQCSRTQQVDAELQLGDVDRREVDRLLVRDGMKIRRTDPPSLDGDPDLVSISQPKGS
jgi:hypothetical protein